MENPIPNSSSRTLRIEQISGLLGVHQSTVRRYQKAGMPHTPTTKTGPLGQTPTLFNEQECREWVKAQGFAGTPESEQQKSLAELIKAQILRKTKAQADTYQLELQKARGEVISRAEVDAAILAKISAVRNGLLGLASSLAPQLVGLPGVEIQNRIEVEVMRLLESFSRK